MNMPRLTAISGVGVKGPACFLFEQNGKRLLLDLGKGPDNERLPDISTIGSIDAILFSHGHIDHTGGLCLWEELGSPPLYSTRPTISLSQHAALKTALPLEDFRSIFDIPIDIGPCGHAPGAVWMRLGGETGLVYSGDVSLESTLFRSSIPPRAAALILDASYATDTTLLPEQISALEQAINGPTLFPCPAGGRGLEIALHFLKKGYDVQLCASHRRVAETLLDHAEWLTENGRDELTFVLKNCSTLSASSPLRGIMVAASANAESGTAKDIAERLSQDGNGDIIFTGHIASGTASRELINSGKARFMRWNVHPSFPDQKRLVEAVAPDKMLAAFCSEESLSSLRAASLWPIISGTIMEW